MLAEELLQEALRSGAGGDVCAALQLQIQIVNAGNVIWRTEETGALTLRRVKRTLKLMTFARSNCVTHANSHLNANPLVMPCQ